MQRYFIYAVFFLKKKITLRWTVSVFQFKKIYNPKNKTECEWFEIIKKTLHIIDQPFRKIILKLNFLFKF